MRAFKAMDWTGNDDPSIGTTLETWTGIGGDLTIADLRSGTNKLANTPNNGELWVSTNERMCHVPGWTKRREWTKYPEQRSMTIWLVAGQLVSEHFCE